MVDSPPMSVLLPTTRWADTCGEVAAQLGPEDELLVIHLGINEFLGVRRWTAVLAYPTVFVFVPLILYGLARRTFVWGGRRYRMHGKFDVTVVE